MEIREVKLTRTTAQLWGRNMYLKIEKLKGHYFVDFVYRTQEGYVPGINEGPLYLFKFTLEIIRHNSTLTYRIENLCIMENIKYWCYVMPVCVPKQ